MNEIQRRKVQNVEKPFPGCLGRMVNLFDFSPSVTGNKLLTHQPHRDASSLSRSRSDVVRVIGSSFGYQLEDKMIVSDSTRASPNKKINGTPIKMLIDQEMSKEFASKHNAPNVVAKLMGLDALPCGEPNLAVERSDIRDYSQHMRSHSGTPFKHRQLEDRFMDKEMLHEVHLNTEQIAYKDIYDIWLRSHRTSNVRDKTPEREKWTEDVNAKKMALIYQKFMEAKCLSTDERLRQSKEFDEALEVLSSNNDLLIQLLDSPNLYELQSTPLVETKRITVLKPSKMVDNEKSGGKGKQNDKQNKKPANVCQAAAWEKNSPGYSPACQKVAELPVQPTRIVVLKPSSGKTQEIKAVASPTMSSPRNMQTGNLYQGPEDGDALEPREAAKEITHQMHESPRSHQRDEAFYSSVFSNGYTGDESSFDRSDNEYTAENLIDVEVMSPSPRHSWDYINRCGSPYSSSSFSRASCSPEPSVCREAKKRLSERWAIMASNKGPQDQRHLRRSSTLGEMLALSDIKKSVTSEVEGISKTQEPSESVSCSRNNFSEEICMDGSPKNLPRSKSVPVSSTVYETSIDSEVCDHDASKTHYSKELTKSKSMKSSFKGKVTSFLFSRNKKATKEKSPLSQSKDESQSNVSETSVFQVNSLGALRDAMSQSFKSGPLGEFSLPDLHELSGKTLLDSVSKGKGTISLECELTVSKTTMPGISTENQDQPSPISVLEPPFEDDNATRESLDCMKGGHLGSQVSRKSNLIDKSPPIESIARTLSWDDSCAEVSSPYSSKPSSASLETKVEEQDLLVLAEKLLSAAGLDDQVKSDSFNSKWHSLESALDPSFRDTYADLNEKESQSQPLHEAKRRQIRSNQKLVFDCVNVALMEISGYGSENFLLSRVVGEAPLLVNQIVAQMKDLNVGLRSVWGDCGDSNNLVLENIVRKEVVGKGWVELMGLEVDIFVKEIEGKLLEELVDDAVVDFTCRA
ncbi:hypothetical protein Lal_00032335 [Lupinus albus]|uniref:Uncharacterized protein n=1 Tax=Lupinus albus TaxID=3870 RepID=A0A6A5PKF7_LUPAL|nr:hypothetical protein Lalb_Chr01g0019431 [Lupinus albus]KAF1897578.1 hypothetical protein Lal_00032335 [Lupinus albus]